MTIEKDTIKNHNRKYILMSGDQTLGKALQKRQAKQAKDEDYTEDDTYLIVALPDGQYAVAHFLELASIQTELGPESLSMPLSELPLSSAARIVPRNTPETSDQIIEWVENNAGLRVVVVNVVALFTDEEMPPQTPSGRERYQCPHCRKMSVGTARIKETRYRQVPYSVVIEVPYCYNCRETIR